MLTRPSGVVHDWAARTRQDAAMPHRPARTGRAAARVVAGVGAGAALLSLTACSVLPAATPAAGPATPARQPAGPTGPAEPAGPPAVVVRGTEVEEAPPGPWLRSRVTRVAGELSDVRRERVARQARATVRGYLDGAFAGEDGRFDGFLGELRRAARADEQVLAGDGRTEVARARAWFAVAAPHGKPVGLTARLAVDLTDPDRGEAVTSLTGRLLMTRAEGEWQVFGYDVARSTDGAGR